MNENKNIMEIYEIVLEYFENFPEKTELSLAVIDKGITSFYGYKKNGEVIFVKNEDSIFGIGSITKVLSATVLADSVINDGIELESLVEDFYDFKLRSRIKDKIVNLANHTSGFASRDENFEADIDSLREYYSSFDDNRLMKVLESLSLYSEESFGKYSYSNYGMGLLGHILSSHHGISFEKLLKERVFDKYEMMSSFVSSDDLEEKIVKGLDKDGNETEVWHMNALVSAGGVFSCSKDLANYICSHFKNNDVLKLVRTPTLTVDSEMKVGLGIHIVKGINNYDIFWHNGGGGGYKSAMEFNVETLSGVVVLSNVSFFNPNHWDIDRICSKIMNELIKKNAD